MNCQNRSSTKIFPSPDSVNNSENNSGNNPGREITQEISPTQENNPGDLTWKHLEMLARSAVFPHRGAGPRARGNQRPGLTSNASRHAASEITSAHGRFRPDSSREYRRDRSRVIRDPTPRRRREPSAPRTPAPRRTPRDLSRTKKRWLRRTRRPSGSSTPRSSWDARSSSTGSTVCSISG